MKNRNVGFLITGIAGLLGFIIYSFNRALTEIVDAACSHGKDCPMWKTIEVQTSIGVVLMILVFAIGLYLVFFSKEIDSSRINPRRLSKEQYKDLLQTLDNESRTILETLIDAGGGIFQSELGEKTGLSKVKVTRGLDRLEGLGVVERKRRGMTNMVLLK